MNRIVEKLFYYQRRRGFEPRRRYESKLFCFRLFTGLVIINFLQFPNNHIILFQG